MATKRYLQPAVSGQERELEKWDDDARRLINTHACKIACGQVKSCANACNIAWLCSQICLPMPTRTVSTDCTVLTSDRLLLVCADASVTITLNCAACLPGRVFDITNIGSCLYQTSESHCAYPCESITYISACGGWRII